MSDAARGVTRLLDLHISIDALAKPARRRTCVASWCIATAIFVGLLALLGGPSQGDAPETVTATIAVGHGDFRCAYPSSNQTPVPPLYPLLSGAVVAVTGLGGDHIFPPGGEAACQSDRLAPQTTADLTHVLWIGVLGWLAFLAGLVLLLRAALGARRLVEPVAVIVVACLPTAMAPVATWFHPEDLVAMGLFMAATAAWFRQRWLLCGLLAGLAVCSKQYALLGAVPLVVVAPRGGRERVAGAALGVLAAVGAAMWVLSGIGALRSALGEGARSGSGTVMDMLGFSHGAMADVARLLPIIVCAVLAWAVGRRLGTAVSEPLTLLSLLTICLSVRLVFEIYLYGYYFMAGATLLVLMDLLAARVRLALVAWLAVVFFLWPYKLGDTSVLLDHQQVLVQIVLVVWMLAMACGPVLAAVTGRPWPSREGRVLAPTI